jgi:hypothetical protein
MHITIDELPMKTSYISVLLHVPARASRCFAASFVGSTATIGASVYANMIATPRE